jgi:phosphatidate cytidylyltransferase
VPAGSAALGEPAERGGPAPAAPGDPVGADQPAKAAGLADPVAPAKSSRAGRDLPAAIAVGLALGGAIVALLFTFRPGFVILVGLAALVAVWELVRSIGTAGPRAPLAPAELAVAGLLPAAWFLGRDGLLAGALIACFAVAAWRAFGGVRRFTADTAAGMLIVLYVPFLAGFAALLTYPDDGAARVIAFIATGVCSDVGGYAVGVLTGGRHKLAPAISPGKSWEGFAGSLIGCAGVGVLFFVFTFHQAWWEGLVFGLVLALTATGGDLVESMIKRDVGVKDMGRLLPGHGGVMDRLDSLLPGAAVSYLLFLAFL